jgi:enediyne biosynthesis protein E4
VRRLFLALALVGWSAIGLAPMAAAQETIADPSAVVIPKFVDVTGSAGIDSVYKGEWQYMVGGGVAVFDCSGDGFPDILLSGGEAPAKFYRNVSKRGGPLRFEPETSGLELDRVIGAYPIDIDGDGIMDLVLLRVGGNVVMRGLGGCKFERANELWGFNGGDAWSTAFAATWERGAEWPTIAIGNYIDRHEEIAPWGTCTDNWLFRPGAVDGKPDRRFAPPLALKPSFCSLSMLFSDWNRSGTPSLRVANDREYYEGGQEQLWRIEPGKAPALYSESDGWKYLRIWGMGIASADLDGSGYPSYFVTSMSDNKLQVLARIPADGRLQPSYKDVAWAKGVTAHWPYTGGDKRPSTAWHAQFADFNNSGLLDLFVTKGNVAKMPDFAMRDPNDLLLQTSDGKFHEAGEAAGIASFGNARGAAVADFNLSGLLDIVVVNRNAPAQVWQNVSANAGHWLELRLQEHGPNRDAIGAWLEARCGGKVMRQEITVGGGHASGQSGWRHFGLGDATAADVRVIWPDGAASDWQHVAGDSLYVLERDKPPALWAAK